MNSFLLNRQLGSISPQTLARAQNTRLLQSLQAAPDVRFSLNLERDRDDGGALERDAAPRRATAHAAGVNSIAVDRFEGR